MLSQSFPSKIHTTITQTKGLNYYKGPVKNTQNNNYAIVYEVLVSQMQTIEKVKGKKRGIELFLIWY